MLPPMGKVPRQSTMPINEAKLPFRTTADTRGVVRLVTNAAGPVESALILKATERLTSSSPLPSSRVIFWILLLFVSALVTGKSGFTARRTHEEHLEEAATTGRIVGRSWKAVTAAVINRGATNGTGGHDRR